MLSPLYGQLSPLRVSTKVVRQPVSDADAEAYLVAVEAADAMQLEQSVADAINSFVIGCKSDGIWTAIKASCILAGARSLSGALVPIVGSAPTNFNFVGGDYSRKTGLKGGTSKYLNSNRGNNSDPQNSKHIACYMSEHSTRDTTRYAISVGAGSTQCNLFTNTTQRFSRINSGSATAGVSDILTTTGFWGASRGISTSFLYRYAGATTSVTNTSTATPVGNLAIYSRDSTGAISVFNGRFSFYSIGQNLDLALLDTRVSTLMTALAAAIP